MSKSKPCPYCGKLFSRGYHFACQECDETREKGCPLCGALYAGTDIWCASCREKKRPQIEQRENRLLLGWAIAFLMFLSGFAYAGHLVLASAFSGVLIFFGLCVIAFIIGADAAREYFEMP